jgi:hypothetical protein
VLSKLNYWIGIPVVIVTALAGSAIVVNQADGNSVPVLGRPDHGVGRGAGESCRRSSVSANGGVQRGRRRPVQPAERRIEDCIAFPPDGLMARLAEIQKLEDDAAEQSPPLGERRWLRWQAFAELPTPPTRRERWKRRSCPVRDAVARQARTLIRASEPRPSGG